MNIHRIHELGIVKELDPTNNFSQPPPGTTPTTPGVWAPDTFFPWSRKDLPSPFGPLAWHGGEFLIEIIWRLCATFTLLVITYMWILNNPKKKK